MPSASSYRNGHKPTTPFVSRSHSATSSNLGAYSLKPAYSEPTDLCVINWPATNRAPPHTPEYCFLHPDTPFNAPLQVHCNQRMQLGDLSHERATAVLVSLGLEVHSCYPNTSRHIQRFRPCTLTRLGAQC